MGTLRIYGDSFSADLGMEWQYIHSLAKYLNMPMVNTSLFGCANEWILKNLMYDIIYEVIQPDDFILVVTTSETRQWFFKNSPDISNFNGLSDLQFALVPQEISAIKSYVTYLQNENLNMQRHFANSSLLKNLLEAVETLGCRTLLLPGFFDPKMSNPANKWLESYIYKSPSCAGSLNNDVCFEEFDRMETSITWYRKYQLPDIRANHMLKQNHYILYNKIVDYLENGVAIDLTTGFNTKIITPDRMHQYWSYREETIDIGYWSTNRKQEEWSKMQVLLKRLEQLEQSRPDLPYVRSPIH